MHLPLEPIVLPAWMALVLPLLGAIVTLALGWMLAQLCQRAIRLWLPRAGGNAVTVAPLVGQATRYAILVIALITALSFLGVPTASILTVVGAASLALALALQNTLSNVASGIMLAWIRPIAVGDYITGDSVEGVVVEIGLFGTRLRSTSGLYVFTNNNKLWNGAITNHSREPRRRIDVDVTVPDATNINTARQTLLELAGKDQRVLGDPAPIAFVKGFGTNDVTLELRAWVPTPQYRAALRDLTEAVKLGINQLLAQGAGGAEIKPATDPHVASTGDETPEPNDSPGTASSPQ